MRAGHRGHALHIEEILGGVRNAVQHTQLRAVLPRALRRARLHERALRHDANERAEPPVEGRDASKQRFGVHHRAQLTGAKLRGQACDRFESRRGGWHDRRCWSWTEMSTGYVRGQDASSTMSRATSIRLVD